MLETKIDSRSKSCTQEVKLIFGDINDAEIFFCSRKYLSCFLKKLSFHNLMVLPRLKEVLTLKNTYF